MLSYETITPPFGQQILEIAQAQGKPMERPNGIGDDGLIPNGVNADSDWGFPKPRKCDSIAAYLGGRSDGCSNSITVGF